jgi:hypothetical protein
LQSILTDSTLHTSSADLTTKEILSRYGDIVRGNVAKQTVQGPDSPAAPPSAAGSSKSPVPVATRVDVDPYQANAWQKQSSVRPIQNFGPPSAQQDHGFAPPMGQFAIRDRAGSAGSREGEVSYGGGGGGTGSARQSYQNKAGLGVAS